MSDIVSFKAILTLYGEGKSLNRYELTDANGNQMSINDLNGYQKGVIINDCYAYFEEKSYFNNSEQPCGVIKIIDEEEWTMSKCVFSAGSKEDLTAMINEYYYSKNYIITEDNRIYNTAKEKFLDGMTVVYKRNRWRVERTEE